MEVHTIQVKPSGRFTMTASVHCSSIERMMGVCLPGQVWSLVFEQKATTHALAVSAREVATTQVGNCG